jgi:hypothetical protein
MLEIEQIQQNTGLFWMPIDVRMTTNSLDTTFTVWDSLQSQLFEFDINEEPRNVEIDPDNWILKKSEIKLLTPYADNVSINRRYQSPGNDTLILTTATINPENSTLELAGIIESIDGEISETIPMDDDGLHNDSSAGDGIYGAAWPVPAGERSYNIHIKTLNQATEYYNIFTDASYFTTTGPLVLDAVEIASEDTVANPGDFIGFQFTLRNMGITDTVFNLSSKIISVDGCADIVAFADPIYGDIAPGESSTADRNIRIRFDEECMAPANLLFYMDIYSDDRRLWQDSFSVNIVTDIADNASLLPQEFALRQNHPNPFNPITIINYQLPITNDVDLSIYNMLGQKVATLVNERKQVGYHHVEWDASGFASGVYYYRIEAGEFVDVKKMILLR